jgi:hypothetical protein
VFFGILGIFYPYYILLNFEGIVKNPSRRDRALVIGVNLSVNKQDEVKWYPVLFSLRRITFVYISLFFSDTESYEPGLNVIVFMISQLFTSAYLMKVKPFLQKDRQRVDIINEIMVLL